MSNKVSDATRDRIYRRVQADLEPSRLVVHSKIGLAVTLGGGVSLFLCGQMGFGLSDLAHSVHRTLMDIGGFWGCTIVCGLLFAVVPSLALRLITSPMQFQTLLRKEKKASIAWVLGFGILLTARYQPMDALVTTVTWAIPAILSFYCLGWLLQRLACSERLAEYFRTDT